MFQNRRFWLLAVLAVVGVVYSVLATRWWILSWSTMSLLPLMREMPSGRLVFGPFWFGIQLIPITIAVALLRVNVFYAAITVVVYAFIMNAAQLAFEPGSLGSYSLLMAMAFDMPFNLGLQLPVWGLTWLAVRAFRSSRPVPRI